jgi:ethanolamine utilization protein EutN
MLLARVEGKAISTIKHPSLSSWRMLIVQPLDIDGNAVDFPTLAIDSFGADAGEVVMITSDGKGARRLVNDPLSPVRWTVMGIVDHGVDVLRKNSSYYRR